MQRRFITATAAIAMAVSGWAASAHAQALSGDPDQNRKPGVAAGKEVNGAVGINSGDATAGGSATVTNGGAQTGDTGQAAGSPQSQLPMADSDGIRRTVSQVTEAALRPDGLGQIGQYLAGEDANRLRDLGEKNSILNQQVQNFQRNWRQKYNQDFAIKDQQLVLNDRSVQIVPGAIVSANQNASANNQGTARANENATAGSTGTTASGAGAAGATGAAASDSTAGTTAARGTTGNLNPTAAGVTSANPTAANTTNGNANETAPAAANPNPTAANSQTPNANPTAAGNNAPTGAGTGINEATPASARQPAGAGASAGSTAAGSTSAGAAGTGATGGAASTGNVATLVIPASHNMPQASTVLTREAAPSATGAAGASTEVWKLDLPDSADVRSIQQNLARQLRSLNEAQATWPAQANDAYNMVAHAVVLAMSEPGQYPAETHQRPVNNNANRANQQQQPGARSNVGGGTGPTGAATDVGAPGTGTTGAGSTGSQSTGAGPSDNNTTGAGSTGSGGQNP
jgi:hypothetical protein